MLRASSLKDGRGGSNTILGVGVGVQLRISLERYSAAFLLVDLAPLTHSFPC